MGSHLILPRGFRDKWGLGWACWGSSRMSRGRRSLWEETEALCGMLPTPHPARTASPAQRPHCEAGPPASGGGAGGMATGPEWQRGGSRSARQGPRNTQVPEQAWPSSHVCPAEAWRVWGNLGSPSIIGRTQVSGKGELCAWGLPGSEWSEAGRGPEPTLSCSHLDLVVLLGIGEREGVCLHRAGHRGPTACLGCPPLLIQTLPRGPALGQHLHQLLPSIHLSVVAAAPAATPAGSPVPARGHVSRYSGTLSQGAGPRLSHWAKPSSYPIGAASTGWRA